MPNLKESFILWTHTESSVRSIKEFVNGTNLTSIVRGWSIPELLRYEDTTGNILNIDRIYNKYSLSDKAAYRNNYLTIREELLKFSQENIKDFPISSIVNFDLIESNTVLALPKTQLNRDVLIGEGNQVDSRDFETFLADKLSELLYDSNYIPLNESQLKNIASLGINKDDFPQITVWCWCRSLSKKELKPLLSDLEFKSNMVDLNLEGTIINLTPFISNLNTSSTKDGGTFNFELAPIIGKWDDNQGFWIVNEDSYSKYIDKSEYNFITNGSFHKVKDNQLLRNDFLFHNIISENDIVFIRYETLNNERKERLKDNRDFEVSPDSLTNRIYDMIGLVDSNNKSSRANNDVNINISGRDLTKLLIEDGCYFYPLDFIPNGIFANENSESTIERLDGKIYSLTQGGEKTIEYSLKFIINALSNMNICPNQLFDAYKSVPVVSSTIIEAPSFELRDERSKKFNLNIEARKSKNNQIADIQELQKKAKAKIKQSIFNSGLEDLSPSVIIEIYGELKRFLSSASEKSALLALDGRPNFKVNGWNPFLYNDSKLNQDTLPENLEYVLFKPKVFWVDATGKAYTDAKRLTFNQRWNDAYNKWVVAQLKIGVPKSALAPVAIEDVPPNEVGSSMADFIKFQKQQNELFELELAQKFQPGESITITTSTSGGLDRLKRAENERALRELDELESNFNDIVAEGKSIHTSKQPFLFSDLNQEGKSALNLIWEIIFKEKQVNQFKDQFDEVVMPGIWQIIKLVIDDEVRDRRIVDSSIGNESGSIINHIRKVCQEPFVEFYTDTYKDQFYLVARKPPFTRNKIKQFIDDGLVIDIEEYNIIEDNTKWNDNQSFSWYKLTPQSILGGEGSQIILAYLKAVHFPEFSNIFGNKPLDIITNYISHFPIVGEGKGIPTSLAVKQVILDLKYLIEIMSPLPFTKSGTIIINGDRRIKRGTWVRLKGTGEIFYVDSLSNSASISTNSVDRTTILNVNRGMVEKYVLNENINYFNIIDTFIDESIFSDGGEVDNLLQNWRVNKEVFNFFLRREQLK